MTTRSVRAARACSRALAALLAASLLAACGGDAGDAEPSADSVANAAGGAPNVDASTPAENVPPAGDVPIDMTATAGGDQYAVNGVGDCRYSNGSTLYDAPVEQWTATYDGGGRVRHARVTLFRHKDGSGEEFSASLRAGDESHEMAVFRKGDSKGSGAATVDMATGKLEAKGKDEQGRDVTISLKCARWLSLDAVGAG